MSMSVINSLRPRNSYRVKHHASMMPNARLIGTVSPVASSVSLMACRMSGSDRFSSITPTPSDSALLKIRASGRTRRKNTNVSARPTRPHWCQFCGFFMSAPALPYRESALYHLQAEQQQQRYGQDNRRNGRGGRVVVFRQAHEDHQRGDFGLEGNVAGNHDDGAEFTQASYEGLGRPRDDGG